MEQLQPDRRPCAHCGGAVAPDDTTCATCGQPYIPDTGRETMGSVGPRAETPAGPGVATPPAALAGTVSDESRAWAIGAHLSALGGVLLGGRPAFLGPLVVWLRRRDARDGFATDHARARWRTSDVARYCVSTLMRSTRLFTRFESTKSISR